MTTVESFDSFEQMQAVLAAREEAANAGLLDVQIALRDDDEHTTYWVRPFPAGQCLIFGRAWSWKESAEVSAKYVNQRPADAETDEAVIVDYEESLDEAVYEIQMYSDSRQRGYLRGVAYSIIEPNGEQGDTHVASVMPISQQAFEEAKAAGWRAVDVPLPHLLLMGEEAARKGGWTPTLIKELKAHEERMR